VLDRADGGWITCELGQEEAGKQQLQKTLELDPNFPIPWATLSLVHGYEGKLAEAVAEAQEAVRLSAGAPLTRGCLAHALAKAGRQSEALAILDQLEELSRQRHVPAIARVLAFLGLGDHDRAIEWLENGYCSAIVGCHTWRWYAPSLPCIPTRASRICCAAEPAL